MNLRAALRRNHAWIALRRASREGWGSAYARWRLWRRILQTEPITTRQTHASEPIELHLLCYRDDYLLSLWALKSFYRASGEALPLVIHLQGDAPRRVAHTLQQHFPQARLVLQREADDAVEAVLTQRNLLRLIEARRANHYMMKLTDFLLLSSSARILTLDGDVLFFRRPSELLAYRGPHLFQRDPESTYVIETWRGEPVAPRLNAGIMSIERASIDLARCNAYVAELPTLSGWLEQTLYAIHATETGQADRLPETYLISLEPGLEHSGLVARHYAGPSRPLLTREGLPYLIRSGFLEQAGR